MDTPDPSAPNTTETEVLEKEAIEAEDLQPVEEKETPEEAAPVARELKEPTAAEIAAGIGLAEEVIARPITPIPVIKRRVRGLYRSCPRPWELTLRVDVDGYRPMNRLSGDYHRSSGSTVSYFGSFVVESPTVTVTDSQVTIVGLAKTTWPTSFNKVRVVIPRHTIFQPPAAAHAQWMTSGDVRGAKYTCTFDSIYFRTVDLEQDHERGVTPFVSYNTGSLPSGGPARTLTVARAYAEAGLHMRDAGMSNVVDTSGAGPDAKWSNSELHLAMESHFSRWKDIPQWKVWLFHAMRHEYGAGLLGIMFDQKGKQRQGCAAFYQRIAGMAPAKLRDQLYVCVHELGHCFNLYHSFHKKYMNPPMLNRPAALSWMNYPQNYPGGASAFWPAFPFQFDNLEVIHLRHAFRNNIVMGGNPFGIGAALEDPEAFADTVEDQSGLRLEIEAPKSFAFGEPPAVEIKLYLTDTRGKRVHRSDLLNPNFGFVQLAIQKPSSQVIVYEPPIDHCVEVETTMLDMARPSIYESAYVGYDKERGQVFDQPGAYKIRGVYYALDGSEVLSNVATLWVRSPMTQVDQEVAELLLGDEQGMLLYVDGSDSPFLQNGNAALELLLEKHGKHALATYAQRAKGYNLSHGFKTIMGDNKVSVRKPNYGEAAKLLSAVVSASEGEEGVDNITLNRTMQCLARAEAGSGKKKEAQETVKRMVSIFEKKKLKPHVLELIRAQAEELKQQI